VYSPLALLVLAMATCGTRPETAPTTPEGVVRAMTPPERLVDGRTGEDVELDVMLADLAAVQAIYLGERHDRAEDHAMQHTVLRSLHTHDPGVHLGMEMFQAPFQPTLDLWVAGELDETALRTRTEWDRRWGFDYALYRPILEYVRARGVPTHALNAPAEVTRTIAREGIDALDEEARAALPELVLDDEAHRALVGDALRDAAHGHAMDEATFERFYTAQVVWDETMASNVAAAIDAGATRVIVMAGGMHVRGGLGIPQRAQRRGVRSHRIVLAMGADELEALLDAQQDGAPPVADYYWVGETFE